VRRLGLLALLAISAFGAGAAWIDSQIVRPYSGHRPAEIFVDIPHGTSRWGVAGLLRKNDVIRDRLAFALFSDWHFRRKLQAGEYLFDRPLDSRQVFWKIAHGQIFVHVVTVPEGWTMFDIAGELDRQGICPRDEFLQVARDTAPIKDLSPHAETLEGFLFPSTYEFTRHTTCAQVADTMVREFRSVWSALDPEGALALPPGRGTAEIVTVASLVERETPQKDERPLVAGVFYNRLKIGDPLQCDPTVQYALALKGTEEPDVKPADLQVNSPYNTYTHRGLPPGPIANPGRASLEAALDPAQTDYLYFVANGEGGHFFSRTLAEHNRNVARYRRILENGTASEAADSHKFR
jgi:UPF0755 protein